MTKTGGKAAVRKLTKPNDVAFNPRQKSEERLFLRTARTERRLSR